MAVFTVELGELIDSGFELDLDKPETYPIFDEDYRAVLNTLITNHFMFREIGQETPEIFRVFLHRTLNEIMPYYNELYKSQLITFNPLYSTDSTIDTHTVSNRDDTSNEESTADVTNNTTGRVLTSTTPQTQLTGNMDYASGLSDSNQEGKQGTNAVSDLTAHGTSVTDYTYHVAGYSGQNPSDAIMRFRQSLVNVNLMVLRELETLFMGLWGIGR